MSAREGAPGGILQERPAARAEHLPGGRSKRSGAVIVCAVLLLLMGAAPLHAHKLSDSYLSLRLDGTELTGQWDISLRDLEYTVGLDADGDGAVTWKELRDRQPAVAEYALARLRLAAGDGTAIPLRVTEQLVDEHTDGTYAVLRFRAAAPLIPPPRVLQVEYRFLFDLDPLHRGLLKLDINGEVRTAIFGPENSGQRFDLAATSGWGQFSQFVTEGIWHIWTGYDHVLFLCALLLPAVLTRENDRWEPKSSFSSVIGEVLRVITAFTLAHSLTLSLAALGLVHLPSRLVEAAIAASVVLAALNNLRPSITRAAWVVAFTFGLIHGFGFASVLIDLHLPPATLALGLAGFNSGVELAQLAIAIAFLPLTFLVRRTSFYRRMLFPWGSAAIALVAALWFTERLFNVLFLPF